MSTVRQHRIYNFLGDLIAFYRPRKKTYYLMSWSNERGNWKPAIVGANVGPIKRHGTGLYGPARSYVTIRLMNNRQVEISSIGHYLLIAGGCVPIVSRVSGASIPLSFVNHDFGGVTDGDPHRRDVELWTVPPVVVAARPTRSQTAPETDCVAHCGRRREKRRHLCNHDGSDYSHNSGRDDVFPLFRPRGHSDLDGDAQDLPAVQRALYGYEGV